MNWKKTPWLLALFGAAGLGWAQPTPSQPTEEEVRQKVQMLMQQYQEAPVIGFDVTGEPVLEGSHGPIQIVEFADVLCPTCRNVSKAMTQLIPQIGDRATIYFKSYPLEQWCNGRIHNNHHPGACWLALGLVCAQDQGKFEPFYKKVFGEDPPPDAKVPEIVKLATDAGLDGAAMETCLQSDKANSTLAKQIDEAGRGEVEGTPTFFINGKKLSHISLFLTVVDMEAQKAGFPPLMPRQAPPQ